MKFRFLTFIFLLIITPFIYGQKTNVKRQPIIDMHLHAYPADMKFSGEVNPATQKPLTILNGEEHLKITIAEMKRLNIVRAIVSVGEGAPDAVFDWKKYAPDLIVPSIGFFEDGFFPEINKLRKDLKENRYFAIGEIGAQYAGLSLSDPKYEPYLALAEEFDIPVAIHTGLAPPGISYDECCRKLRTHFANPLTVEEVLNRHPKLRLYLMHAGYPYKQETIALMMQYPNIYADLAVINWVMPREAFHDYLETLVRNGFGKRLMFGSDQMQFTEAIEMAIEGIESAKFLSEEQKRDIFCNNAARFMKWETTNNPCLAQ